MKKIATTPLALMELIDLLEQGYHCAYEEDCGDYYTVLITNDDGKMKENEITDRYFDFEYIKDEEEEMV